MCHRVSAPRSPPSSSPDLSTSSGRVAAASIDREERKGKGASDHAPVIVDLFTPAPGQDLPL